MPHGAKTYLAAALVAGDRRAPRLDRPRCRDRRPRGRGAGCLARRSGSGRDAGAAHGPRLRALRARARRVGRPGGRPGRLAAGRAALHASWWRASRRSSSAPSAPDDIPAEPFILRRGSRVPMERRDADARRPRLRARAGGGRARRVRPPRRHPRRLSGRPALAGARRVVRRRGRLAAQPSIPADQRGIGPLEAAALLPASEFLLGSRHERDPPGGDSGARLRACPRRSRPTSSDSPAARSVTPPSCGAATWRRRRRSIISARPSGSSTSPPRSRPWPTFLHEQDEQRRDRAGARRRAAGALGHCLPGAADLEGGSPGGPHARAHLGA